MKGRTFLKDVVAAELANLPEQKKGDKKWRPVGGSLPAPVGAVVVDEDDTSFQAHALYSDLRVLLPEAGHELVIEAAWIVGPACHPHSDKQLLAIKIRRGEQVVRALFPITADIKPVVDGSGAFELIGDFFTKDEVRAALRGVALRLEKWESE